MLPAEWIKMQGQSGSCLATDSEYWYTDAVMDATNGAGRLRQIREEAQ